MWVKNIIFGGVFMRSLFRNGIMFLRFQNISRTMLRTTSIILLLSTMNWGTEMPGLLRIRSIRMMMGLWALSLVLKKDNNTSSGTFPGLGIQSTAQMSLLSN